MNSIIVNDEKEINIENIITNIEIQNDIVNLSVKGEVIINEINNISNDLTLNIKLNDNSSLIYNKFEILNKNNIEININQNNKSNLEFNYSVIANYENDIKINTTLNGDNNKNKISFKGVSFGNIKITANGIVIEGTKDNDLVEDLRCLLTGDGKSTIIPNLLISTDSITANHLAAISGPAEEQIFYLNTKGISKTRAVKLIQDGFIINNLKLNEENFIKLKEILKS